MVLRVQCAASNANRWKDFAMDVAKSVIELKENHSQMWRDKSQLYWAMGLLEEVAELIGALLGIHRGPVDWELMQISAICMNWIEMRNPQSLPTQRAPDSLRAAETSQPDTDQSDSAKPAVSG